MEDRLQSYQNFLGNCIYTKSENRSRQNFWPRTLLIKSSISARKLWWFWPRPCTAVIDLRVLKFFFLVCFLLYRYLVAQSNLKKRKRSRRVVATVCRSRPVINVAGWSLSTTQIDAYPTRQRADNLNSAADWLVDPNQAPETISDGAGSRIVWHLGNCKIRQKWDYVCHFTARVLTVEIMSVSLSHSCIVTKNEKSLLLIIHVLFWYHVKD